MIDLLTTLYPWIKSFHVISVIAWMAGLFYLPRLFVYHTERVKAGSETDEMFQTMERRLYNAIMQPAMMSAWLFGLLLVSTPGVVDWGAGWAWIKAASVIAMTVFHSWCGRYVRAFAVGGVDKPGRYFRIMNEVPTLFLVLIVVAVIAKPF